MSLAIITGSGLSQFLSGDAIRVEDNPYGASSTAVIEASIAGNTLLFLPRHGDPHTIPPHRINYRANIWALRQAGASEIVAINTVGGIASHLPVGGFVVPHQLIDYTYGRENSCFDGTLQPLSHSEFALPFSEHVRQRAISALRQCDLEVADKAVCGVAQGPRLETAAEIDRMERDGCDIVGMTAMPEAILARELGIAYACVSLVVNPAAGRSDTPISLTSIETVVARAQIQLRQFIEALVG